MSENIRKHLTSPFYKEAHQWRERVREGQIIKGAMKYPEPFNPDSWTNEELINHAMMENVDQGHYIYGLYHRSIKLEKENQELKRLIDELRNPKAD